MIADQCVDRVALTDNMCIKACKFDQIPTFHQICGKCILSPPISGDMCIFACDNVGKLTANLYNVCFKCSISPPVSYKLCRRACLNTRGNSYYRGICRSQMCNSWNQEFETDALYWMKPQIINSEERNKRNTVEFQWLEHHWDHRNSFMGSLSCWGLIIAPGQLANGDRLITKTYPFKLKNNFTSKNWKFSDKKTKKQKKNKKKKKKKKLWYFSYFCSKHRLWVPVRTASARQL